MSKKEKLYHKLHKKPPPKDFEWDSLVTLMRQAGFAANCEGGSHYMFEHEAKGYRFSMSKTHPSGLLKRYQVNDAITALAAVDYNFGEEDE